MIRELLAQLGELAEKITGHENVEQGEPTQLRLAVHRLGMFAEHLDQLVAASNEEPGVLSRKDLNAQALEVGVESPEKLPNKQAVIDAIQGAEQPQAAPEADVEEPIEPTEIEQPAEDAPPATSSRI